MKKVLFVLWGAFLLLGCERPKHKLELLCKSKGNSFIVYADVYDEKVNLNIKRLSRSVMEFRYKNTETNWLLNELPMIDDYLSITLDKVDKGVFEQHEKLRFQITRDKLSNGMKVEVFPSKNGEFSERQQCEFFKMYETDSEKQVSGLSGEKIKEIKNCNAYIMSQMNMVQVAPGKYDFHVFYNQYGRETLIAKDDMFKMAGDNSLYNYTNLNLENNIEKIQDSCEVADKISQLIWQKIFSYKYYAKLQCNGFGIMHPQHGKIEVNVYNDYAIVRNIDLDKTALNKNNIFKFYKIKEVEIRGVKTTVFENYNFGILLSVSEDVRTKKVLGYSWANKYIDKKKNGFYKWNMCK